jgi:hypothetical protein
MGMLTKFHVSFNVKEYRESIEVEGNTLITSSGYNVQIDSVALAWTEGLLIVLSKAPEGIYRDKQDRLWIEKPYSDADVVRVWPVLSEVESMAMEVADAMDGLKVEVRK